MSVRFLVLLLECGMVDCALIVLIKIAVIFFKKLLF